ncbi:MAG: response regulator, partial [Desulfobacterales bacterium]|nr:response regulator [Desulfobacterales bacterium]
MEEIEKKRILVIEDEVHIADGIRLNLSLQGYQVKIAIDGLDGLDQWRSWKPDLIILDIMLPMIDGFSILKTIRQEDEKIPVLILSARGDTKDKVKGLRYGVDDYLSKPFDLEEFLLRVERLIKKKTWYEDETKDREPGY